jgi:hypothetical protein
MTHSVQKYWKWIIIVQQNVLTSCSVHYTIWRSPQVAALKSSEFSEQNLYVCVRSNYPIIAEMFNGMICINIKHGLPFSEFINLVYRPHNIFLTVREPIDVRNYVNNGTLFLISLLVFRHLVTFLGRGIKKSSGIYPHRATRSTKTHNT